MGAAAAVAVVAVGRVELLLLLLQIANSRQKLFAMENIADAALL
jgi:hypothetical protein